MKALILGDVDYLENGLSVANGLQNLDIESGFFSYQTFLLRYGQNELKRMIFMLLETHKPKWIFYQCGYNPLPPEWFGEMKSICPDSKISLTSTNIMDGFDDVIFATGKYIDVCFQRGGRERYLSRGLNCHILQTGYSDLLFYEKDDQKILDIVFAGSNSVQQSLAAQERIDMMKYLCHKFNGMKVFGTGWENVLPPEHFGGFVELSRINDIYNTSKIILNINSHNDIEHYWSARMIEGMASGNMMLTKYVPGLENYFKNFEEIVWFYSLWDCIWLLEYYLIHEHERELIAKKGRLVVQRDFRWEVIMKKAYDILFPKIS